MTEADQAPLLLYDGNCEFCRSTVRFIRRHDRRSTLQFVPLDSPVARNILADRPDLAGTDSLMWVYPAPDDAPRRIEVRSAAALRTAAYLGGAWSLLRVMWIVPRPLRDAVYRFVARHRHRIANA